MEPFFMVSIATIQLHLPEITLQKYKRSVNTYDVRRGGQRQRDLQRPGTVDHVRTPFLISGNFCPGTEYVRAGEVYGLSGKKNLRQRGSTLPEAENSMKRRWGGVPAAQCFSAASITPSSSRVVSAACSQYMTPSRPFSIAYTHLRRTASGDSKLMKSLPFQR